MSKLTIVPLENIPKTFDVPLGIGHEDLLPLFKVATNMEQLCNLKNGIGLAAAQCGIPWNFFIVYRNKKYEYYINCEYFGLGEKIKSIEGCLSITDKDGNLRRFEVDRWKSVRIMGYELKIINGILNIEKISRIEDDLYSTVFQHEIDHQFEREKTIDVIGQEIELNRS